MLRNFYKSDVEQAAAIEELAQVSPWSVDTFRACFEAGYAGWVIELNDKIIGYVIISLGPEECHILNLAIAREHQRQGWGAKLLEHALNFARQHGAAIAYLEVRKSNTRAMALYKKNQFLHVGERKDYYPIPGGKEDAYVFAKSLV